jgi:hypothetical protein
VLIFSDIWHVSCWRGMTSHALMRFDVVCGVGGRGMVFD